MKPIVTICGTSRPGNYTGYALEVVNQALRADGVDIKCFRAADMTLSFPGQPSTADSEQLRDAVRESRGIIIATPEYHGSFAAMTKLIIENLGFPSTLKGKAVALLGVAAGRIGAIKSIEQLRGVCAHTGAVVMPGSISIASVRSAFDESGLCTDEDVRTVLGEFGQQFRQFIGDFVCPKHILEEIVRTKGKAWVTSA